MADSSTEVSLKDALRNLLTDPSLSDVNLEATDNVLVHANRCILAARSQVFRILLYGYFLEAGESVVRLGYDSEVLKNIVEYCLTDDAEIIRLDTKNDACDENRARKVVALIRAANYFDLPDLKRKAESWAFSRIRTKVSLACFFLDEASAIFDPSSEGVERFAFQTIQSHPTESLFKGDAVAFVSESVLETIVKDKKMWATELTLFQAISVWTNAAEEHVDSSRVKRRRVAEDMTKHILLERISPRDLLTIVEPSGLATEDQLLQAYRSQAVKFVQQPFLTFEQMRFNK